jgi:hypothetical protein
MDHDGHRSPPAGSSVIGSAEGILLPRGPKYSAPLCRTVRRRSGMARDAGVASPYNRLHTAKKTCLDTQVLACGFDVGFLESWGGVAADWGGACIGSTFGKRQAARAANGC